MAARNAPAKLVIPRSLQLGVFRLGLLKDRDVGVGVFPKGEEILVGGLCPGLISRQSQRSAQLQMRQCAYRVGTDDAAVVENFLEFRSGFGTVSGGQVRLATHIDRIEPAEERVEVDWRNGEVEGGGDLQQFDSLLRLMTVQFE